MASQQENSSRLEPPVSGSGPEIAKPQRLLLESMVSMARTMEEPTIMGRGERAGQRRHDALKPDWSHSNRPSPSATSRRTYCRVTHEVCA